MTVAKGAVGKTIFSRTFAIGAICLLTTSFASLSYAQSAWDRVVAAAKKEGRVVLYTSTVPPVSQRIAADFAVAYPDIKLEYSRVIGSDMNTKLTQERLSNADGA